MGFAVIDLTDPLAPKLLGSSVLAITAPAPTTPSYPYYYYDYYGCGIGYYYNPTGVWQSGARVAQVGSTIVLEELAARQQATTPDPYSYYYSSSQAILHAVDLSVPANIRLVSSHAIGEGASSSGLFVDGTNVFTSHQEEVAGSLGRSRFFVDRLDYTNPAFPVRTKINVPGSLFGVDKGGTRIVTVDYRRTMTPLTSTGSSYPQCPANTDAFGDSWVQYKQVPVDSGALPEGGYYYSCYYGTGLCSIPENCVHVSRTLKLVELGQAGATLLSTYAPSGDRIGTLSMGADRLWISRSKYVSVTATDGGYSRSYNVTTVDTLGGIRAGAFAMGTPIITTGDSVTTQPGGTLVGVLSTWTPPTGIKVFDTADLATPKLRLSVDLPGQSYGYYYYSNALSLDDGYATLSMGKYGAVAMPLQ